MAPVLAVGLLWQASATIWFQPSGLATVTIGSPYFWVLAAGWGWLLRRTHSPGLAPMTPVDSMLSTRTLATLPS